MSATDNSTANNDELPWVTPEEFNLLAAHSGFLREAPGASLEEFKPILLTEFKTKFEYEVEFYLCNIITLILMLEGKGKRIDNNRLVYFEGLIPEEMYKITELMDFLCIDDDIIESWVALLASKIFKNTLRYEELEDPDKTLFGDSFKKLLIKYVNRYRKFPKVIKKELNLIYRREDYPSCQMEFNFISRKYEIVYSEYTPGDVRYIYPDRY
jgi:hypothetical protein